MAMTRKDYELIAKALAARKESIDQQAYIEKKGVDKTAETIAAYLALTNENFKKDTFLEKACGTNSNA